MADAAVTMNGSQTESLSLVKRRITSTTSEYGSFSSAHMGGAKSSSELGRDKTLFTPYRDKRRASYEPKETAKPE